MDSDPVSVDPLPQGPLSDECSELRERFSLLTFLLAGITAVNNDNHHPTLRTIDRRSIDERVQYMMSMKSPHTVVMEGVTALLVQDSEVLASMAQTSTSVVALTAPATEDFIKQTISNAVDPAQALLDFGECLSDANPNVHVVEDDRVTNLGHLYTFHNPTEKIEMDPIQEFNKCVPVPIGKSYWDDIEKVRSGFIFPESGPISFPDHVATINAYLNRFKNAPFYTRASISPRFYEYIVCACWQKMERRIGHWAAVGLLYQLSNIAEHALRLHVKIDPRSPVEPDPKLATYLRVLQNSGQLKRIVSFFDFEREGVRKDNTLPLLQDLVTGQSLILYTKETVVEFHRLVVAAMLCYAQSLRVMRLLYNKKHPKKKTTLKKGNQMNKTTEAILGEEQQTIQEPRAEIKQGLDVWGSNATFEGGVVSPMTKEKEEQSKERTERGGSSQKLAEKISGFLGLLSTAPPTSTAPEPSTEDENPQTLESAARHVFLTSRLLSAVLNSAAFKRHIKLLVKPSLLGAPVDSSQKEYRSFANLHNIPFRVTRGNQTPALLAAKRKASQEGGYPNASQVVLEGDSNEDIQAANEMASQMVQEHDGLQDDSDGDDNDGSEQDQEFNKFTKDHLPMAIEGWMKLLVQHLLAQRNLEKYFSATEDAKHGNDIKYIKAYGVKPSPQSMLPKWGILRKFMSDTLKRHNVAGVDALINRFEDHFKGLPDHEASKEDPSLNLNKIFFSFVRLIRGDNVGRFFGIHCEAALATAHIANFFKGSSSNNNDAEGQQAINPEMVSVSKLCCPACWVLMNILKNSDEIPGDYKVRGFHSTVCPVVLPPWIKHNVVVKLVEVFEGYLVEEFLHLREPPRSLPMERRHGHSPSSQSLWSLLSKLSAETTGEAFENATFPVPTNCVSRE